MEISGIPAIVTGGGSGLGAATARLLAERGASVTILDRDTSAGDALAKETGCHFLECDVTDEARVAACLAEAEDRHGIARILVNCAGISDLIPVVGTDRAHHPMSAFRRIIDINLVGTFNTLAQFASRLCAAPLVVEDRGVIVNTSSIA
ncbi:MAG: SDR family NAD(P)-dependent oxidoreductase, partial [Erythrobacter sp.]